MAALDTNVLVRWLVNDDVQQAAIVSELLAASASRNERWFVAVTVLLELEWVLRSRYRFGKGAITAAFDAMLSVAELEFQHEAAVEQALWAFKRAPSSDFADCLHVALVVQTGKRPLMTFDKRASSLIGASLLNPN